MRGLADKAFAAGFNVILLNQRNCGGTEAALGGLYHSGLTADADHVIARIAAVDGVERDHRRRLFARRQPRAQARRRLWRRAAAAAARCLRRLAGDGARRRAFARSSGGRTSSTSGISSRTEGADAAQGGSFPGRFADRSSRRDPDRARVRRGLHGAAFRLRRAPPTTTTAPARCASSIASACPR